LLGVIAGNADIGSGAMIAGQEFEQFSALPAAAVPSGNGAEQDREDAHGASHLGMVPAAQGITDPNFQSLLKLVGDGHAYVKLSAVYRLSTQFPDYPDAKPLHDAFLAANPERLMWGTDWPHPSIAAAVMPDDGHLLDLFHAWTPDEQARRRILVDTPARLFGR
jgi:predicted TIM-barrel fold metal-dependent hydrolase